MSALGSLIHDIVARAAGAVGLGSPTGRERPHAASMDARASASPDTNSTSDQDLRDRERELRILMSNWM